MAVPKKTKQAIADAIRSAALAAFDEHFPEWSETPPDQMDASQRRVFDAITDVERLATQKVAQLLG